MRLLTGFILAAVVVGIAYQTGLTMHDLAVENWEGNALVVFSVLGVNLIGLLILGMYMWENRQADRPLLFMALAIFAFLGYALGQYLSSVNPSRSPFLGDIVLLSSTWAGVLLLLIIYRRGWTN